MKKVSNTERKPMAVKLMVDPANVRRAVALIEGKVITDEEMDNRFFDREPMEITTPAEQDFEMTVGFVALMMAEEARDKEEQEPRKGKFGAKLADMMQKANDINDL